MAGKFPFAVQNLKSVVIKKDNGNSLQIYPWNIPVSPLVSISINENMFSPLMSGTLIVKDVGDWFQQNKLNTFDEILVRYSGISKTGDLNRDPVSGSLETYDLTFSIVNVKNTTNLALSDFQNETETIKVLTIEFVSKSILDKEFITSILGDENFIGPIMADGNQVFTSEGTEPVSVTMKGFNSYIKEKIGIDIDFDKTWNYCYLKRNNISYPWGKIRGQPTILQTLQYLAENAVDYNNNAVVNFLFWEDLGGYHFRSIESLIDENKDSDIVYTTSATELSPNYIHSLETISEFDGLNILNSKNYFSWYERVFPDYTNPYLDFLDTAEGLTHHNVIFNLKEEYGSFKHINENSIIPENLEFDPNYTQLVESNRVDDQIYGYYSKNRYNTPFPQDWEYLGLSADPRLSNVSWQNQFDIDDEVYPEVLYVYDKIIKKSLIKNREKYTRLKNIKRKWEVYRCTVCCDNQLGGVADRQLLAGLTGTDYLYYFGPTGAFKEFKDEYSVIAAGSFSDVVNYEGGNTFNNGLTLSYNLNSYPYDQTVGDFYNIENIEEPSIGDSLVAYQTELDRINVLIPAIENFNSKVDSWIISAVELAYNNLTPGWVSTCAFPSDLRPIGEVEVNPAPGNGNECCWDVFQRFITGPFNYLEEWFKYLCCSDQNQTPCDFSIFGLAFYGLNYNTKLLYNDKTSIYYNGNATYNTTSGDSGYNLSFNFGNHSCGDELFPKLPLYVNLLFPTPESVPDFFTGHWPSLVTINGTIIYDYYQTFSPNFYNGNFYYNDREAYPYYLTKAVRDSCPSGLRFVDGLYADELPFKGPSEVPWLYECSKTKLLQGLYISTGLAPFGVKRVLITTEEEFLNDPDFLDAINNNQAWCESCLDPIALELSKYEYIKYLKELKLRKLVLERLISKLEMLQIKYQDRYSEFLNRKAFFISKNPFSPEVQGNILNKKSPLSLFNIKSIKRKPIRGSKYEVLAKRIGITGGSSYPYSIFFDDNNSRNPGITGNHPYYDQKFKSFNGNQYATKPGFDIYQLKFDDFYYYDDNFSKFGLPDTNAPGLESIGGSVSYDYPIPGVLLSNTTNISWFRSFTNDPSDNLSGLFPNGASDLTNYTNRSNVFKLDSKNIPSLEKEKISSYVRIEFTNPIGLDRLSDFPTGFVRDAGSEYFLPYIVQLTSGPNGRQTIQNNAVVIGMDPYGFDVAIKKNKTKNNYSDYKEWGQYWWHTPLNKLRLSNKTKDISDMNLWAETTIENEFTYYQNNGEYLYNVGGDYTEYDNYAAKAGKLFLGRVNPEGAFFPYYTSISSKVYQFIDDIAQNKTYSITGLEYFPYSIDIQKTLETKTPQSSKYGSYNLLGSHLHTNIRRSWYDFTYLSKSYFDTSLKRVANYNNLVTPIPTLFKTEDFIAYGGNDYLSALANAVKLKDTTALRSFLNSEQINNLKYDDLFEVPQLEHIKGLTGQNLADQIFADDIETYLNGDLLLYRPGLITSEVWKYDIFGESEYGLTSPPVLPPEYDLFDNNFAAQFVVFGRSTSGSDICKQLNLKCANPNGPVDNSSCPANDPYCNCPAKNIMPKETEPSYKDLAIAYEDTKECKLIEKYLGKEYLGCMLSDPDSTSSCNCPEQGKNYESLLATTRSNATFYSTPPKTPLRRQAQMTLFNSQKAVLGIYPNDAIKIGSLITIDKKLPSGKYDLVSGKWMVTGISRIFKTAELSIMLLNLSRDSIKY